VELVRGIGSADRCKNRRWSCCVSHSTFFSARIILVSTHEADGALRALKRHPAISWGGDTSLELWASTLRSLPMNEDVRRQVSVLMHPYQSKRPGF
jgi:hypothetical protein